MIQETLKEKNIIGFELSGKLTDEDYQIFVPEIENALKVHSKLRLLVVFNDFKGWDLHALWDDIKFDIKHFTDFEKIALVGDKTWEKWMAVICKPFTMAKVKHFDTRELPQAMEWLETTPARVVPTEYPVTPY